MARYKDGHAAETHERIVGKASGMIRERGLDRASVAEVMKAAGLTVGGFYAQFADKDALLVEAMAAAIAPSEARFRFLVGRAKEAGRASLVAERYLSEDRVANLADGCAAAALVSELHRAPEPVRGAFEAGAAAAVSELAGLFGGTDEDADLAWGTYAMLVGALALLRALPAEDVKASLRRGVQAALDELAVPPSADAA